MNSTHVSQVEDSRCPACEAAKTQHDTGFQPPQGYRLKACGQCGLVYAWPRPTPEELSRFYSEEYFHSGGGSLGYADYRDLPEANAKRMWPSLKKRYGPILDSVPRILLDVGCATGAFLAEAKADGWRVVGVDFSKAAVNDARGRYGIEAYSGDIHLPELESAKYGLVTMWHVLEHLIHPQKALERAYELAASGGLLYVELPNWWSMGRLLRGSRWSQMKPPEHINYYAPRVLRDALARAGFRVIHLATSYPSIYDKAAVPRLSRPFYQAAALAARCVCAFQCGGYLQALATKEKRL